MSIKEPLSEQEFDDLDDFLMSDQCGDETMTSDGLHGYLTALTLRPIEQSFEDFSAPIWGPPGSPAPVYASATEATRIGYLIARMRDDIAVTLEVATNDFEPLFGVEPGQGKQLLDGETWAWGFWVAVTLQRAAWQELFDAPEATLLRPIYLLGAEQIEEQETTLVETAQQRHQLALEIEAAIPKIYRFWRA